MNPNNVDALNLGFYDVKFKDGQKIHYNWPQVKIHGLLTKEPRFIFVDGFKVEDKENNLVAEAIFNRTRGKGMLSWGKKKEEPTNQVELKLLKDGKEIQKGQ